MIDVITVLYPQLQGIDFRRDVPALQVPVFLAQGRHEAPGRSVPADEWFSRVVAPSKEKVEFASSAHRAIFEQPGAFRELMVHVAAQTSGR